MNYSKTNNPSSPYAKTTSIGVREGILLGGGKNLP